MLKKIVNESKQGNQYEESKQLSEARAHHFRQQSYDFNMHGPTSQ